MRLEDEKNNYEEQARAPGNTEEQREFYNKAADCVKTDIEDLETEIILKQIAVPG